MDMTQETRRDLTYYNSIRIMSVQTKDYFITVFFYCIIVTITIIIMEMGNLIPHHLGNYGTDAAQIACSTSAAVVCIVQQRS